MYESTHMPYTQCSQIQRDRKQNGGYQGQLFYGDENVVENGCTAT